MKKWVLLALAMGILAGVGAVLLSTRQAPLVSEAFEETEQAEPSEPSEPSAQEGIATGTDTASTTETISDANLSVKKLLSVEEFRALLVSVRSSLPRKETLQGMSEVDTHSAPEPIIEAGRQLGRVSQALADDPSHAREAFAFYENCAGTLDYADSVRALCFFHYRAIGGSLGLDIRENVAPLKIRELADRLQGS